jgi:hypothetical protein
MPKHDYPCYNWRFGVDPDTLSIDISAETVVCIFSICNGPIFGENTSREVCKPDSSGSPILEFACGTDCCRD